MNVTLALEAEADLEAIGDYIARDNAMRADSFVSELIAAAYELGAFPRRFPILPRYAQLDIRHRVHGRYLILYRVEEKEVLVLRIIHGSRDQEGLLFLEG